VWTSVSAWAKAESESRFPGKKFKHQRNAYRHMLWQAGLVYRLGWDAAYAWAAAHEAGTKDNNDHKADLYNNSVGRVIGLRADDKFKGPWRKKIRQWIQDMANREIANGNYRKQNNKKP
jgi:hypothetical protein